MLIDKHSPGGPAVSASSHLISFLPQRSSAGTDAAEVQIIRDLIMRQFPSGARIAQNFYPLTKKHLASSVVENWRRVLGTPWREVGEPIHKVELRAVFGGQSLAISDPCHGQQRPASAFYHGDNQALLILAISCDPCPLRLAARFTPLFFLGSSDRN